MPDSEKRALKRAAKTNPVSTGKNPAVVSPTLVLDLQTRIKQLEQRCEELFAHCVAIAALAEQRSLWTEKDFDKALDTALANMPSVQEQKKQREDRFQKTLKDLRSSQETEGP